MTDGLGDGGHVHAWHHILKAIDDNLVRDLQHKEY